MPPSEFVVTPRGYDFTPLDYNLLVFVQYTGGTQLTDNTCLLGFSNLIGSQVRRQIQSHQVSNIRINLFEISFVLESLFRSCNGRLQIGLLCGSNLNMIVQDLEHLWAHHDICKVKSTSTNMGSDKLGDRTLAQVDMEICGRVDRDGHRSDQKLF